MLSSVPVSLLVGCILGFLAGLGIGGGSLLMLWLTLVLEMPYPEARMLNLLFFRPCAIAATLLRRKQGAVPLGKIWPAIGAGCLSAMLFSLIGDRIDLWFLKKAFGVLLLFTGVRELLYRPKAAK